MAVKLPFFSRVKEALSLVVKGRKPERTVLDKLQSRLFSAASVNRLTQDWSTNSQSADSSLRRNLRLLRARSRDLVDDNDFAQKYVAMVKSNVLGEMGITMRCKAKDPDMVQGGKVVPGKLDVGANKAIELAWWEWSKKRTCTVTKQLCWKEVQEVCLESVARDGECLVRLVRGAKNRFGFSLQLIESDLLDIEYNEPQLKGGGQIRMGVEVDALGAPVAYHLWTKHPEDTHFVQTQYQDRVRVPASDIIHPFITRRIGQTRGYPWLATSAFGLKMLGGYSVAEVTKARLCAAKMAFFKRTGEAQYQGEPTDGGKIMDVEPGLMEELDAGLDVVSVDWNSPNMNYGEFVKAQLRQMASGLGVFYANLGNDHESINFSSSRVGLQDERDTWKNLQCWFAEGFCNEVFEAWLETALAYGAVGGLPLSKFDKFNSAIWNGRRWEWVDPTKEVAAKISEINAGLSSISTVLSEMGIDRDELFDQIADDKKAMEERGISFSEILHEPPPDPIELAEAEAEAAPKPAPKRDAEPVIHVAPVINVKSEGSPLQTRRTVRVERNGDGDITGFVRTDEEEPMSIRDPARDDGKPRFKLRGVTAIRNAEGNITEFKPQYDRTLDKSQYVERMISGIKVMRSEDGNILNYEPSYEQDSN